MADYGRVLANVASWATNRPKSRLLPALENNSGTLTQLTSDFKYQFSKYQIASFYEMKPTSPLSKLVSLPHLMFDATQSKHCHLNLGKDKGRAIRKTITIPIVPQVGPFSLG